MHFNKKNTVFTYIKKNDNKMITKMITFRKNAKSNLYLFPSYNLSSIKILKKISKTCKKLATFLRLLNFL